MSWNRWNMIVRVSAVLNRTVDDSHWWFVNCAQVLKKMLWLALVKLSSQTYFCSDTTRFWPDSYKYLLWHISIKLNFWSIRRVKDRTKYLVIQGFDGTKLTFDRTLFVDQLLFQALVWYSTSEPKWVVSCQLMVLNSGCWSDRSIGQLTCIVIGCLSFTL